ncbi:unnamed protein product [Penicillium glandicola]
MVFKTRVLVHPTVPLVPGLASVGPLDQYMMRILMPIMCVFELRNPSQRSAIVHNLQLGLAHTIDEMNFLAANIVLEDDERQNIQLDYDANGAGVWFHEADIPELEYEILASRRFPLSELTLTRFVPNVPSLPGKDCAVLTVQVTFITGGVVLSFIAHHSLMDGQALGTFAQTWARNTHAASEGRMVRSEDRLAPETCDPSPTFGGCPNRCFNDFYTYRTSEKRLHGHIQDRVREAALINDRDTLAQLIPVSQWYLPADALDRLKNATKPPDATQLSVTEHPSTSALIWRHVSRARKVRERGVETSSLFGGLNARRRMEPLLPVEYCFNAMVGTRAIATTAELYQDGDAALYNLARKVADSIDWWTPDRIWELTGAIDSAEVVANRLVPPMDFDVTVTNPYRMGDIFAASEWGVELGKPKSLRWEFCSFTDGMALVLPEIDGGLEIMLWAGPEVATNLQKDEEWMKWVVQVE